MTTKKSLLLVLLTLVLLLAISLPALAASGTLINFDSANKTDIPEPGNIIPYADMRGHWAYTEAIELGNRGFMRGTGGGFFSPEQPIDRAMMISILWNIEGRPLIGPYIGFKHGFSDVAADAYYAYPVVWGAFNKLISGISADTYGPTQPISREQIAVMLYRYAQLQGNASNVGEDTNILSYTDASQISEYAMTAMQWACGAGIITGRADGSLAPLGQATRAEVAVMVYRFVQLQDGQ